MPSLSTNLMNKLPSALCRMIAAGSASAASTTSRGGTALKMSNDGPLHLAVWLTTRAPFVQNEQLVLLAYVLRSCGGRLSTRSAGMSKTPCSHHEQNLYFNWPRPCVKPGMQSLQLPRSSVPQQPCEASASSIASWATFSRGGGSMAWPRAWLIAGAKLPDVLAPSKVAAPTGMAPTGMTPTGMAPTGMTPTGIATGTANGIAGQNAEGGWAMAAAGGADKTEALEAGLHETLDAGVHMRVAAQCRTGAGLPAA